MIAADSDKVEASFRSRDEYSQVLDAQVTDIYSFMMEMYDVPDGQALPGEVIQVAAALLADIIGTLKKSNGEQPTDADLKEGIDTCCEIIFRIARVKRDQMDDHGTHN